MMTMRRGLAVSAACAAGVTLVALHRWRARHRHHQQHHVLTISNDADTAGALERFHSSSVVGLDVEWKPGSTLQAALLQISTGSETVLLRLSKFKSVPKPLIKLLKSPRVLKVGVGVMADLVRLEKWAASTSPAGSSPLLTAGGMDLVPFAKRLGCTSAGLAALSREVLGELLPKGDVRCSDWEADELSSEQLAYAANDARASLRIYQALCEREEGNTFWRILMRLAISLSRWLDGRARSDGLGHGGGGHGAASGDGGGRSGAGGGGGGRGRTRHEVRVSTRSKPLYDGWLMLSPEGVAMCRMSASRARYYLTKNLAEALNADDPLAAAAPGRTIKLKFQPKGLGNASEPALLLPKSNECVGCGCGAESTRHVRFSIVPHAFRRHLPSAIKDHDSHDVVLLCTSCYAQLEGPYERRRAELMQSHGIDHRDTARFEKATDSRARSAAVAMTQHGAKLPAARRAELEALVAAELGVAPSSLTTESIEEFASRTPDRRPRNDWVAPEERLVRAVVATRPVGDSDPVRGFVRGWRELFVAVLHPVNLPPGWQTDHRRER